MNKNCPDSSKNIKKYDLIVVGGGMVGAALACLCAQNSNKSLKKLSIAVVENKSPKHKWDKNSHDIRVSAITHASKKLLQQVGAWPAIVDSGANAYENMKVWDSGGGGEIEFNANDVGEENLGYIIENRIIQRALQQRLSDFDQIDFIHPFQATSLNHIENSESHLNSVQITNDKGEILEADLIIGADGANSWVRQQSGIDLTTWAYNQTAVVATVMTSSSHQSCCWQQFMPQGPLAFLPLDQNYSSIVWSTSAEQAKELVNMEEGSFNQRLQETFGDRLGEIKVCSERGAFPLRMRHAKQYVKTSLALIGDAAHTVHPLAGQGVNLGFQDVISLAEVIKKARGKNKSIGALSVLREYERSRKGANVTMLAAMDGLKNLFSNNNPVLSFLRNTGLNLVNNSSFSKKFFINYALGK